MDISIPSPTAGGPERASPGRSGGGVRPAIVLLALVAAGAIVLLAGADDAHAKRYAGTPAGGGRIALTVNRGALRRAYVRMPARCESLNGRRGRQTLRVDLRGREPLRSRRFSIQGRAPNGVRFEVRGRVRRRTVTGRVRLSYVDLDFVGPSDDSFVCQTRLRRFRARSR